jgi:hypothetical protein
VYGVHSVDDVQCTCFDLRISVCGMSYGWEHPRLGAERPENQILCLGNGGVDLSSFYVTVGHTKFGYDAQS